MATTKPTDEQNKWAALAAANPEPAKTPSEQEKWAALAGETAPTSPQPSSTPFPQGMDFKDIVEEMHPNLSTFDRLGVKILGNRNEGGQSNIDWLQRRHPELMIREHDGRVLARKPSENQWRTLDPNTGFFSGDFARDTMDIAGDVAQGALEGYALAQSGGNPIVSGLVGGASEAGRQMLGKMIGIEGDPDEVKTNAIFNAALPVAGKYVARPVGRVASELMGAISGVPAKAIWTAMMNLRKLDKMEKQPMFDAVEQATEDFREPVLRTLREKGEAVEKVYRDYSTIDGKENKVIRLNVQPMLDVLQEAVQNAERIGTETFRNTADEINKFTHQNLLKSERGLQEWRGAKDVASQAVESGTRNISDSADGVVKPAKYLQIDPMTPYDAWQLKKVLDDAAERYKIPPAPGVGVSREMTARTRALDAMIKDLDDQLSRATGGASKKANREYRVLSNLRELSSDYFSTPERAYSTLTNMDSKAKVMLNGYLERLKKLTGVDLKHQADMLFSQAHFGDKRPGGLQKMPVFGGGASGTVRGMFTSGAGGWAGKKIAESFDPTLGPLGTGLGVLGGNFAGSPYMMKKYVRGMNFFTSPFRYPGVPQTAWHLMRSPGDKTKIETDEDSE